MRVKRWLTPPPSRPPERAGLRRAPPRSVHPPLARPVAPPSIVSARQYALEASNKLEPTARRDPYRVLGQVLARLPPISSRPSRSLPARPRALVEHELAPWRHACAVAHSHLCGPLRHHRHKFRNSVVRVVGHTMRLLLRLGHVDAANELDRAFFTEDPPPPRPRPTTRSRTRRVQERDGNDLETVQSRYALGNGLGLARGHLQIAWMQSLAVRLGGGDEAGDAARARRIRDFLVEMRHAHAGRELNPALLAFIVRKLEQIHAQLAGGTSPARKGARKQVRQVLRSIKQAETSGQEIVSLALLNGAVEKLERQASGRVDMALYSQVERELETLIGSLDGPPDEDLRALTELHERVPDVELIDRHSHILYLAIRFLVFRSRHSASSPNDSTLPRSLTPSHTLSSASQLYALLLELSPAVARGTTLDLSRLRQRQSSALYRLLWAHLGVFDAHYSPRSFPAFHKTTQSLQGSNFTRPDAALIESAYDLIDLTLESTSSLPRPVPASHTSEPSSRSTVSSKLASAAAAAGVDPRPARLVGVSTRFHRHALYLLSLPSAPSRRNHRRVIDSSSSPSSREFALDETHRSSSSSPPPGGPRGSYYRPPSPPPLEWSTFQRVFDVIQRQRIHDRVETSLAAVAATATAASTTEPIQLLSSSSSSASRKEDDGVVVFDGDSNLSTTTRERDEWERDLVVHPAFAIHLLRATLLGGGGGGGDASGTTTTSLSRSVRIAGLSNASAAAAAVDAEKTSLGGSRRGTSSSRRGGGGGFRGDDDDEDGGTPLTRLGELFDVIKTLETGSVSWGTFGVEEGHDESNTKTNTKSEASETGKRRRRMRYATEAKARRLFRNAVDVVVEDEWKGEGARAWRDLVKSKVRQWADESGSESRG